MSAPCLTVSTPNPKINKNRGANQRNGADTNASPVRSGKTGLAAGGCLKEFLVLDANKKPVEKHERHKCKKNGDQHTNDSNCFIRVGKTKVTDKQARDQTKKKSPVF